MTQIYEKELLQTIQGLDLVLLSDWNKFFSYPKQACLRQMIFHDRYNINKAVRRFGGRIYIKVSEFKKLIEEANKQIV